MGVFAMLTLVMHAATSRAFVYGRLVEALVHAGFFLLFFALFAVFARKTLDGKLPKKAMLIATTAYVSAYIVMMLLLIGFQKYIPAISVSIVYVAAPFAFIGDKKEAGQGVVNFAVALVVLFGLTIPGYFYNLFEISARERYEDIYISEEKGYFVHGIAPKKLYVYTPVTTDTAEILLHNSLQAYTCMRYTDQVIYESDVTTSAAYTAQHLDAIAKYYPDVEQKRVGSRDELLDLYAGRIKNYILYDDSDRESLFAAANLCNQMEAVMVGKSIKSVADKYGWKQVFDTTGWTEKKFVESEYFGNIDNHLLILMDTYEQNRTYGQDVLMTQFWDLGIMNNAWISYNGLSLVQLENKLKKLKRNSVCIGSLGKCTENGVVQACARYATTFIYTRYTANISVLSGFALKNATVDSDVLRGGDINKATPTVYSDDKTPKHTVCVMLSDADNVRFCTESLMSDKYYRSPLRDENLQYNIGLAGSLVDIAPIFLLEFYDGMYPSNDFCYQLSSIGYTYPSKWTDKKAWEQVTKTLARVMKESKTHVLEIMDDSAFMTVLDIPSNFGALRKYFDTYTCYDEVDGCLFIDYTALYSGYRGAVCWSNDKPVVSAKYSIWWDEGTPYNTERNTIDYVVKEINEMSADKTSEDAYTFIIVHGWSGLNANGDLVGLNLRSEDIDNTAIFKALRDGFDEDVEMVTTTEFINRMRRNVKR